MSQNLLYDPIILFKFRTNPKISMKKLAVRNNLKFIVVKIL